MKIITCASYYGTGSSAVTDLFDEFANCYCVGNYEFRFIHDPDGIRDLEYNLIENNNRHNTSNAIKRYLKLAKHLNGNRIRKCYSRYMGDTFLQYTNEFVDQITELKCNTWWHYDQIERGELFFYLDNAVSRLCRMIRGKNGRSDRYSLLEALNEPAYYSAIDGEKFYRCVREYVEKVVETLNKEHTEYVMIDQLLPPSNLNQYLNYFEDIKIIVTERDPRDIFISSNEFWREKVIPYTDVEEFCTWYEITRRHRKTDKYDPQKVFFLQFEDLIYHYETTSTKLIRFVGINPENHIKPLTRFIPAASIKNTNLKRRFPKYQKEMECIERRLGEYLYTFPNENQDSSLIGMNETAKREVGE